MSERYFTTPRYEIGLLGSRPQVNPFNGLLAQYLNDYDAREAAFQHPLRQQTFSRYRPTTAPTTPTVTPTAPVAGFGGIGIGQPSGGGDDAGQGYGGGFGDTGTEGSPGTPSGPSGNPGSTPSTSPSIGGFGLGTTEGMVGGMIGSLAGPIGGIAGTAVGNGLAGQTAPNVAAQAFGSLAGLALAGPLGGLLGGMVGGHVGGRAENAETGFGKAGIDLGFTDSLAAGLGFGDYAGGLGGYGVSTPAEAANPGVMGVPGGLAAPPTGNPQATASYGGGDGNGGNTSAQGDSPADPGSPAGGAAAASGGHGSTPGVGDSSDGGAGDGGDGGSVICTSLHELGRLETSTWHAAEAFGLRLVRTDPAVIRGYHRWGRPFARVIRKHPLAARIAKFIFAPAFAEMAHRQGKAERGSFVGKIIVNTGTRLSRYLGRKSK